MKHTQVPLQKNIYLWTKYWTKRIVFLTKLDINFWKRLDWLNDKLDFSIRIFAHIQFICASENLCGSLRIHKLIYNSKLIKETAQRVFFEPYITNQLLRKLVIRKCCKYIFPLQRMSCDVFYCESTSECLLKKDWFSLSLLLGMYSLQQVPQFR